MQGWERVITISVRRPPAPQYKPINRKKRMGKIVEDYVLRIEQRRLIKSIGPALETRQFPHHRIRGQQDRSRGTPRGNISPDILRGSAARRCISVPMCEHIRSR